MSATRIGKKLQGTLFNFRLRRALGQTATMCQRCPGRRMDRPGGKAVLVQSCLETREDSLADQQCLPPETGRDGCTKVFETFSYLFVW